MGHFPETDPAKTKATVNRMGATALLAPGVPPNLELWLLLLLEFQCFLRHY